MLDESKSATESVDNDHKGATVEEINAALHVLTQIGYRLRQAEVEVGPSPRVVVRMSKQRQTDPQVLAALLAGQTDRQLLCALLTALQHAEVLQGQMQVSDCPIREIEVTLAAPPVVRLRFLEPAQEADSPGPILTPVVPATGSGIVPVVPLAPDLASGLAAPPLTGIPFLDSPASMPGETVTPTTVVNASPTDGVETSIRFRCTGCRVRYKVRLERAGEALECHRCGTPLTIPAQSTEAPPGYRV